MDYEKKQFSVAVGSKDYRANFDAIFGKKNEAAEPEYAPSDLLGDDALDLLEDDTPRAKCSRDGTCEIPQRVRRPVPGDVVEVESTGVEARVVGVRRSERVLAVVPITMKTGWDSCALVLESAVHFVRAGQVDPGDAAIRDQLMGADWDDFDSAR